MQRLRHAFVLSTMLAVLVAPLPALAYPEATMPEAMRDPAKPTALHVIVPQVEISVGINPAGGGGAGAPQGGLVGALILGAMDASRAKKGVDKSELIRISLEDFDVDALAKAEVMRAFSQIPWVTTDKASFGKDPTIWGKMAVLDAGTAPRLATLEITYQLSPDMSQFNVSGVLQVVEKVHPKANKPEKRLAPERATYSRGMHAQVNLPVNPAGPVDAFAVWTANDAKLLKEALALGVAKVADLSARAMILKPDELAAMEAKDRPKMSIGWHRGRVVEGAESIDQPEASNGLVRKAATVKPGTDGVLIWAGYFVHSRVLPLASVQTGGAK